MYTPVNDERPPSPAAFLYHYNKADNTYFITAFTVSLTPLPMTFRTITPCIAGR